MLATVAAADSASTVRKKYSVFIYSVAEPHAMYAKYKQMLTLRVLQYTYIYIYIYIYMCVCVHASMHVCVCVSHLLLFFST